MAETLERSGLGNIASNAASDRVCRDEIPLKRSFDKHTLTRRYSGKLSGYAFAPVTTYPCVNPSLFEPSYAYPIKEILIVC